jgi:hypothetical protein
LPQQNLHNTTTRPIKKETSAKSPLIYFEKCPDLRKERLLRHSTGRKPRYSKST